jgi:hypothetical protein
LLAPGQTGRFAFRFVPPGLFPGLLFALLVVAGAVLTWNRRLGGDSI